MNSRAPIRTKHAASLATSATALVALVALAATMSSLPGGHLRSTLLEVRAVPIEAPTVRQVAAAVAAAARELVAGERVTASIPADHFIASIACRALQYRPDAREGEFAGSHPLHERLIDLPPPLC